MSIMDCKHNGEYELMLKVWGGGTLCDEDIAVTDNSVKAIEKYRNEYYHYPNSISLFIEDTFSYGLDYGYTQIDTAFLENLKTLKELILPDSIKEINMTDTLRKILKENNTLIRGNFDSYAEKFAEEYGLHFRPSDFVFARHEYEPVHEITIMTLMFDRKGNARIKEDISSPGSAAGNTFGATFYSELPREFYRTKTAEQIARRFRDVIYKQILEEGKLESFLEKARTHKFYEGKN